MNTDKTKFEPSLREIGKNTWEASMVFPGLGPVTTRGNGWEEAKLRLWIVSEAIKMLNSGPCQDPKEWSEAKWQAVLKAMHEAMS